ncbi:MAG: hypothetical protein P9M00_08580 [Candidatus Tritonobacter lacicola]|nr:hypothetical protein [Candidatus Tritonobacter lacicola]
MKKACVLLPIFLFSFCLVSPSLALYKELSIQELYSNKDEYLNQNVKVKVKFSHIIHYYWAEKPYDEKNAIGFSAGNGRSGFAFYIKKRGSIVEDLMSLPLDTPMIVYGRLTPNRARKVIRYSFIVDKVEFSKTTKKADYKKRILDAKELLTSTKSYMGREIRVKGTYGYRCVVGGVLADKPRYQEYRCFLFNLKECYNVSFAVQKDHNTEQFFKEVRGNDLLLCTGRLREIKAGKVTGGHGRNVRKRYVFDVHKIEFFQH